VNGNGISEKYVTAMLYGLDFHIWKVSPLFCLTCNVFQRIKPNIASLVIRWLELRSVNLPVPAALERYLSMHIYRWQKTGKVNGWSEERVYMKLRAKLVFNKATNNSSFTMIISKSPNKHFPITSYRDIPISLSLLLGELLLQSPNNPWWAYGHGND
jgi:hypothetical protein